jgi:hypothetical protein
LQGAAAYFNPAEGEVVQDSIDHSIPLELWRIQLYRTILLAISEKNHHHFHFMKSFQVID